MLERILGYVIFGVVLLLGITILYLPVFLLLRKKVAFMRQLSCLLFAGFTFIILFATILVGLVAGDIVSDSRYLNLIPLSWLFHSWEMGTVNMFSQIISNVIMFIPMGFLLPIVFYKIRSFWKTFACLFAFSFTIEFIQYFIGRSADIDDLILNVIGGLIGYAAFIGFSKVFNKKIWWETALGNKDSK